MIQRLPEYLINQIAAGEVVERPASVVKELLENSIDADARHIVIEVKDGGDTFLRISDDGIGMDAQDAVMALERHATSKIHTPDDLLKIGTLGFRGEALASIASVALVSLHTKQRGALEGTSLSAEGGKIESAKPAGIPEGTQIEIRQLFYNTPARKKYLKNPLTEYNHIFNTVTGIALAFPEVAFKLVHDEKVIFDLPKTEDLFTRIQQLMGKNISEELIPVFYGHSRIQLAGFIGKPLIARSNRNMQYLFVNKREIKSHVLSYAVKESYYSLLPKEKYPVFFLYLTLDSELVDVNVHPRKLEVRFADEREIFKIASQACQKALETSILAPKIAHGTPENYYQERKPAPLLVRDQDALSPAGLSISKTPTPALVQRALEFTKDFAAASALTTPQPVQDALLKEEEKPPLLPLAQLDHSYILCQRGSDLVILDQHAAHERLRYTELLRDFERLTKSSQQLLTPFPLELSSKDVNPFSENLAIFQQLGFEIEPFGGTTFMVQAVPHYLHKENIQQTVLGLFDDLMNQTQKGDFQTRKERALVYMACRSAKKFGDVLQREEQVALIEALFKLELPYTCPHGRPTMIVMTADELQKRFGRAYR